MPHIDQENNSNNDVKSSQSRVHAFARFYNKTQRTVNVIWINYQGTRVRYKTLQKGEWIDVNTFVGHPWVFHDAITGDKLHVQSNVQETNSPQSASVCNTGEASSEQDSVYNPVPWNKDNDSWPPKRRIVYITVPVYTLEDRCAQIVRQMISSADIVSLEIPRSLKEKLLERQSEAFVDLQS